MGEVIELADFTLDQVAELNARYDTLLNSNELAQLFDILSGHPYLIHHALYLVAAHRFSTSELINRAFDDGNNSPFGDHLNRLLKWLLKHSELTEAMQSVLHNENCHETAYQELRRAGLVREKRPPIQSRCHLYTVYFTERLR